MVHALDGAYARIDRTDTHIRELIRTIERFRKATENELIGQKKPDAMRLQLGERSRISFTSSTVLGGVPPDAAILTGETIYNLRAALDYLIFELARHDSGSEQQGTQFPIQATRDSKGRYGFQRGNFNRLKGLSDPHIAAIEDLQPYAGCAWTKTLGDISNPDKHRKLTVLGGGMIHWCTVARGPFGSFENYPGRTFRCKDSEINIHLENFINVTLPDGQTPIIETLQILQSSVCAAIDSFQPEF